MTFVPGIARIVNTYGETIYEKLWGYDGEGDSIVVKEHIRKIRNKLAVCTDKQYIETVWGVGYKWIK